MKHLFYILVFVVSVLGVKNAAGLELIDCETTKCNSIKDYLSQYLTDDDEIILNKVQGQVKKVKLISYKDVKKKYGLSYNQASSMARIWLRYEDIDNDGKKDLFSTWTSYQNTYTDNRCSILIFEYPFPNELDDIFAKGKYKSEYYQKLEKWMIKSYEWDSYEGPKGARNALPKNLVIDKNITLYAGKGFSKPKNDYFLGVFAVNSKNYILVHGRHDKSSFEFVLELTNSEKQEYKKICSFKTNVK